MSLELFLIKLFHTAIVVYLFACLFVIWQYALNGLFRRWLWPAVGSVLLEGAVYAANGFRCPLTDRALALGDRYGGDFIVEGLFVVPVDFMQSAALFFAAGWLLALRRCWLERRSDRDTATM
jgi:hypothetical protein